MHAVTGSAAPWVSTTARTEATGAEATGVEATGVEATGVGATAARVTGAKAAGAKAAGVGATGAETTGAETTGAEATGDSLALADAGSGVNVVRAEMTKDAMSSVGTTRPVRRALVWARDSCDRRLMASLPRRSAGSQA